MTAQTVAHTGPEGFRPVLATDDEPLPLRTELFLIAHDHDSGRLHVSRRRLELVLAGGVLCDLWLAHRIQIGWRFDVRTNQWESDPGRIVVLREDSVGDPLADSVLATLCRTATPRVHSVVRKLAATGLYERVAGDMIAAGILRRVRRRWFRLFRADGYQPVSESYAVRIRNRIRDLVTDTPRIGEWQAGERYERHGTALATLIVMSGLGLMRHLYTGLEPSRLRTILINLVTRRPGHSIHDITTALGRGQR
jgi:hypothetical protein